MTWSDVVFGIAAGGVVIAAANHTPTPTISYGRYMVLTFIIIVAHVIAR